MIPFPDGLKTPDNLISDQNVEVSPVVIEKMNEIVGVFNRLRNKADFIQNVKTPDYDTSVFDPKNRAILMSYDFHLDGDQPKLIEINTNASFALVVSRLKESEDVGFPKGMTYSKYLETLKECIAKEARLSLGKSEPSRIAIVDEDPNEQGAYFEFKLYKDLFNEWGWTADIYDVEDLEWKDEKLVDSSGNQIDFVYNRYCDFYLQDKKSEQLKSAYLSGKVCFSPNPFEYHLMANKERLVELSDSDFLGKVGVNENDRRVLESSVLKTFTVTKFSAEEIWERRKKLFFKPKTLFGSKAVYRGSSISKKAFETIYHSNTVAQEYCPPPKSGEFKYDLRAYTYADQLHLVAARLYQGQVTNLRSPGGGLALVRSS